MGRGKRGKIRQIVDVKHVAKYLSIHPITVYRLLKEASIPAFKLKGQWRFRIDILDAWMKKKIKGRIEKE